MGLLASLGLLLALAIIRTFAAVLLLALGALLLLRAAAAAAAVGGARRRRAQRVASALGRMVDDVRGNLVEALVDGGVVTAGDALLADLVVGDGQIGLGVVALVAQHKLVDEAVQEFLQLLWVVATVDHIQVVVD